jgi:saccharopine dehydrogenase-like NADP-dependent oxidoreductase
MPTRDLLDRAAPHHPVLLWRCDLHLAAANSAALKLAGIDAGTPDPAEGRIDHLRLRVGALPVLALAPSYYAFTWSPIGVATEYVEPATVVRGGRRTEVDSMTGVETLRLGSLVLEEAFTSGGVADLPEALGASIETLDYKTLRHPGHWRWAQEILDGSDLDARDRDGRIEHLLAAMHDQVPSVEADQVIIYAAATGRDALGWLRREERLLVVEPRTVAGHRLRAIQITTAAGLAEAARMLLDGSVGPGPVLQSEIDPDDFLGGCFVQRGYGSPSDS